MKKVTRILCLMVGLAMCVALLAGCQDDTPTGGADGHFSDVHIVFFPGGNEGCPFASVVYAGAVAAAADLGVRVDYMWSDWDPAQMIDQFRSAIAMNPTGIAIMGHPGDDAFLPLVSEAKAAGIIVTSQNSELPVIEARYKADGFGYVGQGLFNSGHMLASAAIQRSGIQPGDTAIVWGLLSQEGRGERTRGSIVALEEFGVNVVYYEISDAVNADPAQGTSVFVSMMAANPETRLVITDHGSLTTAAGTYMRAAGLGPDDIFFAGFDLSGPTVDAINEGYLDIILDQQPWLQGYLPILQIALTATYGFSGLHIDTGASIIGRDNVGPVAALAEAGIR